MNYKKAKHFTQNLDLNKIIIKTNFYFIVQLKAIKISNWVFLKREFKNHNFKIRILPIKLLKNNTLFNSALLNNAHTNNILIIYCNRLCLDNNNIFSVLEKTTFLLILYIFVNNRFYLFQNFKILSQNNRIHLIRIMLETHNLFRILLNK